MGSALYLTVRLILLLMGLDALWVRITCLLIFAVSMDAVAGK